MRALLSLGLDLLGWIGFLSRTAYAIALEHPVPVAVGLVGLTVWAWHRLACGLEHRADADTRMMWTDYPHPVPSFSRPAAKGFTKRSRVVDGPRLVGHTPTIPPSAQRELEQWYARTEPVDPLEAA